MLRSIGRIVNAAVEAAGSVVGVRRGTEEPAYSVERVCAGFEVRRYGHRIAAETTVTADEQAARTIGFRRLAGYIFGGNHAATKIAMTAPVAQQQIAMTAPVVQESGADGEWVIRFFMPADMTMQSLPQPDDPAVRLVDVAAATVAVRRFSGSRGGRAVRSQTAQLLTTLRQSGFEPAGVPAAWFYDPPWTVPALRRNEVAVPVVARRDQPR